MAYFFIISAVILRLLPHAPNFSPIAAMALFGGVYLYTNKDNKKYALIIPLVALFISDLFIGFYNPIIMLSVYGSFGIAGLIGIWLKNHKNMLNIVAAGLCSSIIFFVITNFAMWAIPHSLYPHTLAGLADCFTMALPFFRNTLLGDAFYIFTMFSLMEIVLFANNKLRAQKEYNAIRIK